MEEWEIEYINNRQHELYMQTVVRTSLLDKLRQRCILNEYDVQNVAQYSTNYDRGSMLYRLLRTRRNAFQVMTDVLIWDNQSGAHWILQQELLRRGLAKPKELTTSTVFCRVLSEIDDLLDEANFRILVISTPDLFLSLKRILDVGRSDLFVHDMKTKFTNREFRCLEKDTALVVQCERLETLKDALKKLEGSTTGNLVLLTTENSKEIRKVLGPHRDRTLLAKEEITWQDLTAKAQEAILEQEIKFQKSVIKLKDVPLELFSTNEIRGQLVIDLLNQTRPELVKNSVPPSPSYYVPRKISSRVNISPEAFRNAGKDVFVVQGIELYQLTNLTRKRRYDGEAAPVARSSEQLDTVTAQFIKLEHEDDLKDICELSKAPVHLISHRNGEFTWRKSHNSLGVIQKYIQETQKSVEDENSFVRRCLTSDSPVCIADTPGMGKTQLLTRIAEKVMSKSASENCIVSFLTFSELIPCIENQGGKVDVDFACELIAKSSSDYDLGKGIVIKALKTEKVRCHVFLDGYDELLNNLLAAVNQLLGCLRKLKNTQVYVTTRLNKCRELEEALITTGCRIQPFDEQDQLSFLNRYWNEAGAEKNDRLEEFAKLCLSRVKVNMTETERDIAGIPLQCRLLAEVYTKKAQKYSQGRKFVFKDSPRSTTFAMFQNFVNMSFGKVEPTARARVRRSHMYYAVKLLLPELEQQFKLTFPEDHLTQQDSVLFAPGILEKTEQEDHPRFFHRALAEYMVAQFVIDFLEMVVHNSRETTAVIPAVLLNVLSTNKCHQDTVFGRMFHIGNISVELNAFEYSQICYFLNSFMLAKSVTACAQIETDKGALFMNAIIALQLSNIFSAAVAANLSAIVSFVSSLTNFNCDKLPWANLFLLAAKHGRPDLLCQLTTLAKKQQVHISQTKYPAASIFSFQNLSVVTPLHVAVYWGNYSATVLLISKYGFHELLVKRHYTLQYLLHVCVMDSYEDAEQVVSEKIEIIKWLCSEVEANPYRHVLEERLPDGTTPLLQHYVHAKLIQALIQVGADINAVDDRNKCVLHTVLDGYNGISPVQFHDLVDSLAGTTFKHYDLQDSNKCTPLGYATARLDLELQTVDLFLNKGADMNGGGDGVSYLLSVLRRGRSREFVNGFISRGADFRCRTSIIPAKVMEAVEFVVETTPRLLNTYSWKRLNPADCESQEENPGHSLIAAKLDLQEMESRQLSSYLLSLDTRPIPTTTTMSEPYFVVHRLASGIINRRQGATEDGDCWAFAFNYSKIHEKNLLGILAACTTKVVLLSQEMVDEIGKVLDGTGRRPVVAVEDIGLLDLPKSVQEGIGEKTFATRAETETLGESFSRQQITGKLLFDMTIQDHLTLVNREMVVLDLFDFRSRDDSDNDGDSDFSYRTYAIVSRRNISTNIFRTPQVDTFVVKGCDLHQLSTFTGGLSTDKSSNQTLVLTATFIQLETEDAFDKICRLFGYDDFCSVHLLSYHEGDFSWVKSSGTIVCIQRHIHEQQQKYSLTAFLKGLVREDSESPICLAYDHEHVGLGHVLAELKREISRNSGRLPFCVQIDGKFMEKIIKTRSSSTAAMLIAETLSDYSLGREYVFNCLMSEELPPCQLIFYFSPHYNLNYLEMETINKTFCLAKPLRNTQIYFIILDLGLFLMEQAFQTLAFRLEVDAGDCSDSDCSDSD